jgi:hypothetical protein
MRMPNKSNDFSVAVPWSLSHYIPLNGFHPLYRALFDECPTHVTLNAWDNIILSNTLRNAPAVRAELLKYISAWQARLNLDRAPSFKQKYFSAFDVPNLAATALLPGDIELHHTAPFPSMMRPFVIHCESFAPFFIPFAQQGVGTIQQAMPTRAHYAEMLEHELCLGVFSHIPHTLEEISRFFKSTLIDSKLFPSRIGISRHALAQRGKPRNRDGAAPVFLFINSANQNPQNFVHRGGHIVLRAWPAILASWPSARLYMRCARPSDALLQQHGVDIAFTGSEGSRSIIWIQEFLTNRELNNLMGAAHFLLLPSLSLHSVSIMQAMALGAVPIVSDTIGPSRYLTDGQTGIVLRGVHAIHWRVDPQTGIMVDDFGRDAALDESLVSQLAERVEALRHDPAAYVALQDRAMAHAAAELAGPSFAEAFWAQVESLWAASPVRAVREATPFKSIGALRDCLISPGEWPRLFESTPQPMHRLYTGTGQVMELGGSFIFTRGGTIDLHGRSVFAEYRRDNPVPSLLAASIEALGGAYLADPPAALQSGIRRRSVQWVARLLLPIPFLYRIAARALKMARRLRARLQILDTPEPLDLQLLKQNVSGMNVIRCNGLYHAIPQDAGEFSWAKLSKGGYRLSVTGSSLRQVMDKISKLEAKHGHAKSLSPIVELLEEGFHGLNLIRYGELFLAIPQGEGAFDYDRVIAHGYSRSFSETSLMALKMSIKRASP